MVIALLQCVSEFSSTQSTARSDDDLVERFLCLSDMSCVVCLTRCNTGADRWDEIVDWAHNAGRHAEHLERRRKLWITRPVWWNSGSNSCTLTLDYWSHCRALCHCHLC